MLSAIIFVNDDMNDAIQSTLTSQLEINETMSFGEFNERVVVDPNYPTVVHGAKLRILVKLPDFRDYTNRELADIVIFLKQGLASVEKNKFGPPGLTLPVQRLNIWNLVNGIIGANSACLPFPPAIQPWETQTPENPKPPEHTTPPYPEGMGVLELFGVEVLESHGTHGGEKESIFGGKIK